MQKLKSLKINHFSKNCRNEFNEFADYVSHQKKFFHFDSNANSLEAIGDAEHAQENAF